MKSITLFKFSLQALLANKLRSALTILGVVIGVAAVILMMAIGQGAQASVAAQIQSLGSNLLVVMPGAAGQFVRGSSGQRTTLKLEDANAIARLPFVRHVAPEVRSNQLAVHGNNTWTTNITGTTLDLMDIRTLTLEEGRFFNEEEAGRGESVAVLGPTVMKNLFSAGENPIGQTIRVKNVTLTVIGVVKPIGASLGGQDQDDMIYTPVRTAQIRLLGQDYVNAIDVQVEQQEQMETVLEEVTALLRSRHHITPPQQDDFNVRNLTAIMNTAENISRLLTIFLAGVAAISLVVGGIGIMNIMLVSVTERTREIGVRMAVGATETDILKQFLLEAVFLSMAGAAAGILIGYAGTRLFGYFIKWPMHVSLFSVLLAVGFSVLTGVFFGYYPARRAAALNPSEALSFE